MFAFLIHLAIVKVLNEYNKLAKRAWIQVLCFVEDERTFNNLTFMKSRL
jgi:hypothetical protein